MPRPPGAGGDSTVADPAIIDYGRWALAFIDKPFFSLECTPHAQEVVSIQFIGIWARVTSGGGCVNLRSEASITAPIVDCLGDGALVNTSKSRRTDGDRFWQSVIGPSGQRGWISDEFLK